MKCKKNNIIKKLSAVLTASALLLTGCSGAKSSTQTDQDLTYTDMLFDTVIKIQIVDRFNDPLRDHTRQDRRQDHDSDKYRDERSYYPF